jgi:hypothetical protein
MNGERIERLKQRYRYAEWSSAEPKPPIATVPVPSLLGPEWVLDHVDVVETDETAVGAPDPRAWQAAWRSAKGEQAVSAYLRRCASAAEASEHLLQLLDQFQSPLVERVAGANAVGDVSFAPPGDRAVLFAVSNLVALVRSVGRDAVSARGAAVTMLARLREGAASGS